MHSCAKLRYYWPFAALVLIVIALISVSWEEPVATKQKMKRASFQKEMLSHLSTDPGAKTVYEEALRMKNHKLGDFGSKLQTTAPAGLLF
jgi:hypothetical protein